MADAEKTPDNDPVARLLRQQAALARFGSFAFREADLTKVLNEAARVCAECLTVPFCKICQYREAEDDLLIVAGYGWQAGVVGRVVSQANKTSPQGRSYITGKPVIIEDLSETNTFKLPAFYEQHGIISTIDVIIKGLDGEPFGVLEIDSPVRHVYDEHDVNFLTGFANVLAEAVATAGRNKLLHQTIDQMQELAKEKDLVLDEKSVLAEELKHRVRNNLQLVHGMLTSHMRLEAPAEQRASVEAIVRRVMTLAEIYEQLLGSGMGRTIDLGDYLNSLCASLPGLQKTSSSQIRLECTVEPLLVSLDTVTAIGMVVAELVSNSYEHAFPGGSGVVNVTLRPEKADEAILTVSDDGVGFVEQPGSKRHGVGLVRRLMQQVHGTAEQHVEHGTLWKLRFPAVAPVELSQSLAINGASTVAPPTPA